MVWWQAITEESVCSDSITGWSISAWLGQAPWLAWPAWPRSPPVETAFSHTVKDNYWGPTAATEQNAAACIQYKQGTRGKMANHQDRKEMVQQQRIFIPKHAADSCLNDLLGNRLSLCRERGGGVSAAEIIWHCSVNSVALFTKCEKD